MKKDIISLLRSGEKVICPLCLKGELKPYAESDCKTTHGFQCNNCKETLNID